MQCPIPHAGGLAGACFCSTASYGQMLEEGVHGNVSGAFAIQHDTGSMLIFSFFLFSWFSAFFILLFALFLPLSVSCAFLGLFHVVFLESFFLFSWFVSCSLSSYSLSCSLGSLSCSLSSVFFFMDYFFLFLALFLLSSFSLCLDSSPALSFM